MNNDMPWVNLTQEEVDELRTKKHELTEYGKQRIQQLMNNQEPYPDDMFEVAERRERANRVLQRYNDYYNMECASLPHGTPITPEHQQMITLQSMIDAIRCEYLNQEYTQINITDIEDLIEQLDHQAIKFLQRVQEFKDSADGVA
jgi:DNA-binding MarR family transcriptional regulator